MMFMTFRRTIHTDFNFSNVTKIVPSNRLFKKIKKKKKKKKLIKKHTEPTQISNFITLCNQKHLKLNKMESLFLDTTIASSC